jgi:SAM-dependent methyltransferase
MYKSLKTIAKATIPKSVLEKNEVFFRRLTSFWYKGKAHQCNICGFQLRRFVRLHDYDKLCPNCGSLSRTRLLFKLLKDEDLFHGKVLHFSPSRILYQTLKSYNIEYYSSDFENEFLADFNYDITSIPVNDNFFDLIICYHILEHIEDDRKAISELYRVLKKGGICLIQTPFKDGEIYEDYSIVSPTERAMAFGQKDHVRIYSIEGLKTRLSQKDFEVLPLHFEEDLYFGFKEETIFILKK